MLSGLTSIFFATALPPGLLPPSATVITEADSNMDSEPSKVVQQEELGSCDSGGVVMHMSCDPVTDSQSLENPPGSGDGPRDMKPDSESEVGVPPPENGRERVDFRGEGNQEVGVADSGLTGSSRQQVVRGAASHGGVEVPPDSDSSTGQVLEGCRMGNGQPVLPCDSAASMLPQVVVASGERLGDLRWTDTGNESHDMDKKSHDTQIGSRDLKEKLEVESREKSNEELQEEMEVEPHGMRDVMSHDRKKEMEVESHETEKEMGIGVQEMNEEGRVESHDMNREMEMESNGMKKEVDIEEDMEVGEAEGKTCEDPEPQNSQVKSHDNMEERHDVETKEVCDEMPCVHEEAVNRGGSSQELPEDELNLKGVDDKETQPEEEIQSSFKQADEKEVQLSLVEVQENKQVDSNPGEVGSHDLETEAQMPPVTAVEDVAKPNSPAAEDTETQEGMTGSQLGSCDQETGSGGLSHDQEPTKEVEGGQQDGRSHKLVEEVEPVERSCETHVMSGDTQKVKEGKSRDDLSHDDLMQSCDMEEDLHNDKEVVSCDKQPLSHYKEEESSSDEMELRDKQIKSPDEGQVELGLIEQENQVESHDKRCDKEHSDNKEKNEFHNEQEKEVEHQREDSDDKPMEPCDNEMQSHNESCDEPPDPPVKSGDKEQEMDNVPKERTCDVEDDSHVLQLAPQTEQHGSHDLLAVSGEVSHDQQGQAEQESRDKKVTETEKEEISTVETNVLNERVLGSPDIACLAESHDPPPESHDPPPESHDPPPESHDPPPESHDSGMTKSYHPHQESDDSVMTRSSDHLPDSHDPVMTGSHDFPSGSHDPGLIGSCDQPTGSHDPAMISPKAEEPLLAAGSATSPDRDMESHDSEVVSEEGQNSVNEVSKTPMETENQPMGTENQGELSSTECEETMQLGRVGGGSGENPPHLPSNISQTEHAVKCVSSGSESGPLTEGSGEQESTTLNHTSSSPTETVSVSGGPGGTKLRTKVSVGDEVVDEAVGDAGKELPSGKEMESCDVSSGSEGKLHDQCVEWSHDQPTLNEGNSYNQPSEIKAESHDQTTPAKIKSHDQAIPAEMESHDQTTPIEMESHDQTIPAKMESHDQTTPIEMESHDQTTPIEMESHDQTIPAKMESRDQTTQIEMESHDQATPIEMESHDQTILTKMESHDQTKPIEMESHDQTKPIEIESHDQTKTNEMESHDQTKPIEMESHDQTKTNEMESHDQTKTNKMESHDQTKPIEMESHDQTKPIEMESHDQTKANEMESHDQTKPIEMESHDQTKANEMESHDQTKPIEMESHDQTKANEMESHDQTKPIEMESHDQTKANKMESHDQTKANKMESHDQTTLINARSYYLMGTSETKSHDQLAESKAESCTIVDQVETESHDIKDREDPIKTSAGQSHDVRDETEPASSDTNVVWKAKTCEEFDENEKSLRDTTHQAFDNKETTAVDAEIYAKVSVRVDQSQSVALASTEDRPREGADQQDENEPKLLDPQTVEKPHDSGQISCDSVQKSPDGEPESHESAPKPHDSETKPRDGEPQGSEPQSHDREPKPHDSEPKSHDSEPKPHDSEPKSHDSEPKPHDSEPKSHDSEPKPHDSEPKSHDSEPKPHNSDPKSHDSEPKPHDKVSKSQEIESELTSHDIEHESVPKSQDGGTQSEPISHDNSEPNTGTRACDGEAKTLCGNEATSKPQAKGKAGTFDREDKSCEVKSSTSDSTSGEETEGISCEAEAKQEVGGADQTQESAEDKEFVTASNRVVSLATKLLEKWEGLKEVFRIPKRTQSVSLAVCPPSPHVSLCDNIVASI